MSLFYCIKTVNSFFIGFNYAYRRSVTPSTSALTPNSITSALPSNAAPSASTTPAPGGVPAHLNANNTNSKTPTPPPNASRSAPVSGKATPKEPQLPKSNGALPANANDKQDGKDKQKKDKKKDKREKSETFEKDGTSPEAVTSLNQKSSQFAGATQPIKSAMNAEKIDTEAVPLSPATAGTDSPGTRTPTSKRPPRNPWTVFIRMSVPANENELRTFFGEAKDGVRFLSVLFKHLLINCLDYTSQHTTSI